MLSSAVVLVTPSSRFNSAAVLVTPSRMFSSAAVLVTAVPFRDRASVSNVPSTSTSPEISKDVAVKTPVTASVEAMSTAPSMSTTSKLVVPSTSMSPEISRLVAVSTPVTPNVPATVALTSTSKVSICAVPSKYKSLHSCEELPRSKALSVFGIILLLTSAPNTTLSPAASPKVSVPPLNVVAPVTTRVPPTVVLPVTSSVPAIVALASTSKVSTCIVPSKNPSLNSKELVPKSMSLSVTGTIAPSWMRICSTADPPTSTKTPQRLLVLSTTILFKKF